MTMYDISEMTPDTTISSTIFGLQDEISVPAFSHGEAHVPEIDPLYRFDPQVTRAILEGFRLNRRVLVQGLHGTGKSTHIEQVAARLNWPCVRVNLDGQISRFDFIGKDSVVVRDGHQVTEFSEGILPWALQRPVALILDEYDAGRPDVMFVIQRVLERDGRLTLLDQSRVLTPNPWFRLFATANTIGLGNLSGLYQGTQRLNHAQMDRWDMVASLNYLAPQVEQDILTSKVPSLNTPEGLKMAVSMVAFAGLTREGFRLGDLSTLMSPRTVISWGENYEIFGNLGAALRLSFMNKCDEAEWPILEEYFQRCFDASIYQST